MNLKDKIKLKSAKLINYGVILILLALCISLVNSIRHFLSARNRLDVLDKRLENLQSENEKLKQDLEYVNSSEYIEKTARDSLGMAFEGETVVILPDDEEFKVLPEKPPEEIVLPEPNWKKWMQLFIY
ncbi:MAG: septum formation initiator family protein [Candidatus Omnitrophica bacterium]|nr:septum formation initiator family protein [Candidatus Omnitrophota bacterium]